LSYVFPINLSPPRQQNLTDVFVEIFGVDQQPIHVKRYCSNFFSHYPYLENLLLVVERCFYSSQLTYSSDTSVDSLAVP
jgi:hypothetical protein